MNISLNSIMVGQILAVYIIFATVLAYRLAKTRQKYTASTVFGNFILSLFPPISLIALFILWRKEKINN